MMPRILMLLLASSMVTACASVNYDPESTESAETVGAESSQSDRPAPPSARNRGEIQAESEAVTYLLDRAEQAARVDDYGRALALADRALRIERTAARAYLISAQAQAGMGNDSKAAEIARQGLLYAPEQSPVARDLYLFLP